jgi:hypothetical protein
LDAFRELENAGRISKRDSNEVSNLLRNILSTPTQRGRKIIPLERRKALFYYMGARAEDIEATAAKFKITEAEKRMAEEVRTLLGTDGKSGLAAKFLEDPNDFIFNYMPRLKKEMKRMSKEEFENLSHLELVNKIFHGRGKVPPTIHFWANEERINEILDIAVDDDILSVLEKYQVLGHKRLYMNESWRKLKNSLKGADVPPVLRDNVVMYMKDILGIPQTIGMKEMKKLSEDVWTRLGGNRHLDSKTKNDILSTMFSLNYLSTMGWRPFQWFRNMFQIYTTLAPRFGNTWVHKAVREAADIGEDVFQHLEQIGVVLGKDDLPIFGDVVTKERMLGKLTRKGLKRYKNSDDFTRVVAYLTAKGQWDDAVEALQRKVIGAEQFVERSGVNLLEPEVRQSILSLVEEGKWSAAMDLYGSQVVDETMFPYRRELKPHIQGATIVGRVFGRYGTYAMYYISNLAKGFKYGSKGQKAAFAARWLANSLAIYGAFQAVGINADEFLPWTPMFFSGGPEFNLAVDVLRAASGGHKVRQTLRELKQAYGMFLPGFYQGRSLVKFFKYAEEGDYWKAMMALTSAPIKP